MVGEGKAGEGRRDDGAPPKKKRPVKGSDTHVAKALRSAYEETVREDVPSDFLDLLGKLA